MLSNPPVDSMGLLEVKCVMKDSVKYSEVVALWVAKRLQQFGFCRHYMFVIHNRTLCYRNVLVNVLSIK